MTSYYHLPTDTERHPVRLETKLADGYRIGAPAEGWTPELAALCGFVAITPTTRPADTPTHTSERNLVRTGNTVTETWTMVPKTAAALAAETQATNTVTLEGKARAAVGVNLKFLALTAPSNSDVLKQVRALTQQNTLLAKLLLRGDLLDNTDGT